MTTTLTQNYSHIARLELKANCLGHNSHSSTYALSDLLLALQHSAGCAVQMSGEAGASTPP